MSELQNTDNVSSDPEPQKTRRGRKTFRSITNEHVCLAMTAHLRSLSSIDDDEEVVSYFKVPEGIEVKIGAVH